MHPLNQNDQNHQSHSTQFELAKVPQKRGRRPKVEKCKRQPKSAARGSQLVLNEKCSA